MRYDEIPQRTTTDHNGLSPRPDPAARALATQAAGCPALGISERSGSGASALGFSLVRVISSHMELGSVTATFGLLNLRTIDLESFLFSVILDNRYCGQTWVPRKNSFILVVGLDGVFNP